jgi:hypothetical protein
MVKRILDPKINPSSSLMSIISQILDENKFMFMDMPAYINFYGLQESVSNGKPVPVEVPNSLFGTYLDVDYLDSRTKFVGIYVGKTSEFVSTDAKFVKYRDDAFDLRKTDNPLRTSDGEGTDFSKKNKVVGFSVDYGTQNQNIFKSVSMDMSEKKNTAESFMLNSQIAESASGNKVAQQTNLTPRGVFFSMNPQDSPDFSTHISELIMRQIPALNPSAQAFKEANAIVQSKFPDFLGKGFLRKDMMLEATEPVPQARVSFSTPLS